MSHRAAREACRRTGVADTLAGSPIGHALPAAPGLAPPRGRPQAHNACARHRQIPQTGGAKDPRPSPPRGLGPRAAPAPAPAACVAAAHSFLAKFAPRVAPAAPGASQASAWALLRPAPAGSPCGGTPPGERGRPQGAHFGQRLNVPARHLSQRLDCAPLPPWARPHRPLAARSGLLPSLIGSTYFRSRSQGKKIQVSCDTSVMKVWHIGAPCGLA